AQLWHDIMLQAHADKPPLALPGTGGPVLYDAIARLPWNGPQTKRAASGQSLFRRVFGFFGG
ncbi:MAG: hypothetical protein ACRECF_10535, partial [Methyloceanibacter sp.]